MRRTWTQTATAAAAEDGLAWAFMSPERPRILVSNDDGHQSEGIKALAGAMGELGEVWVVAPETEQSASSHAISIHRPLRMREGRVVRSRRHADRLLVAGDPPRAAGHAAGPHGVGINHGPNLADDVPYSARSPRRWRPR
jgi:5'-nucleotidase